jgi:hypothetical protein
MNTPRTNPLKSILACLLSACLTACSAGRSQYVWHDLGVHQPPENAKISPPTQRWGADADAPTTSNPTIAPGYLLALRCPDDNRLNNEFRVNFDGNLELPYDTVVYAAGVNANQLVFRVDLHLKP